MTEATTVAELLEVVRQLQQQVGELTQRVKDLEYLISAADVGAAVKL